jgi:hypothetical protein
MYTQRCGSFQVFSFTHCSRCLPLFKVRVRFHTKRLNSNTKSKSSLRNSDQQAKKLDSPKPLLVSFKIITILVAVRVALGVPCQKLINTGPPRKSVVYAYSLRNNGSRLPHNIWSVHGSNILHLESIQHSIIRAVAEERELTLSPKTLCGFVGPGFVRPGSRGSCDLHSKKREYGSIRDG